MDEVKTKQEVRVMIRKIITDFNNHHRDKEWEWIWKCTPIFADTKFVLREMTKTDYLVKYKQYTEYTLVGTFLDRQVYLKNS